MERVDVTQALYRSVVELDNQPLIDAFARRVDRATLTMFASAPDMTFHDPNAVNLTLLTTIFGTVRSVFERNLPEQQRRIVHQQLILMCFAWLETMSTPRQPGVPVRPPR